MVGGQKFRVGKKYLIFGENSTRPVEIKEIWRKCTMGRKNYDHQKNVFFGISDRAEIETFKGLYPSSVKLLDRNRPNGKYTIPEVSGLANNLPMCLEWV